MLGAFFCNSATTFKHRYIVQIELDCGPRLRRWLGERNAAQLRTLLAPRPAYDVELVDYH
jgi:hypothetical protein